MNAATCFPYQMPVFISLYVSHKQDGKRTANLKTSMRNQPGDHCEVGWLVVKPYC